MQSCINCRAWSTRSHVFTYHRNSDTKTFKFTTVLYTTKVYIQYVIYYFKIKLELSLYMANTVPIPHILPPPPSNVVRASSHVCWWGGSNMWTEGHTTQFPYIPHFFWGRSALLMVTCPKPTKQTTVWWVTVMAHTPGVAFHIYSKPKLANHFQNQLIFFFKFFLKSNILFCLFLSQIYGKTFLWAPKGKSTWIPHPTKQCLYT